LKREDGYHFVTRSQTLVMFNVTSNILHKTMNKTV